jgi:predicted secreted protein
MRDFIRMNRKDVVLFAACAVIYLVIWLLWIVLPLAGDRSLADTDAVAAGIPVLGDLPTQSVSKLVVTGALYAMALIYALVSASSPEERRVFPQLITIAVLTFLGWMSLNFWVVSGFLNSPSTLLYGGASIVLLLAWGVFLGRGVAMIHDPLARFLMRFGLGLALFVTIVQLVSVLTPNWRSPTQGIPVLYTMTLNALVGVFIAGVGGNMLWRERRAQVLAAGARRR